MPRIRRMRGCGSPARWGRSVSRRASTVSRLSQGLCDDPHGRGHAAALCRGSGACAAAAARRDGEDPYLAVHPPSADYPKGYAMILTDGVMRLRYAEDPAHPRLRQPGEMVKIRITL